MLLLTLLTIVCWANGLIIVHGIYNTYSLVIAKEEFKSVYVNMTVLSHLASFSSLHLLSLVSLIMNKLIKNYMMTLLLPCCLLLKILVFIFYPLSLSHGSSVPFSALALAVILSISLIFFSSLICFCSVSPSRLLLSLLE